MALGQNQDTPSGLEQFLCEETTSNVSSQERYGPDMIAQTDGQTKRQGDSYIPPRGHNYQILFNIILK